MGWPSWRAVSRWISLLAIACLVVSAPAAAADASLVLEVVQKLQEYYVDQVDPVKLLNDGILGLRMELLDANVTADLSKLPAGIGVEDARRLFMERFASAHSAAPTVSETNLAYRAIVFVTELLWDPNTRFLTPEEYRFQQAQERSGFGGIGVAFATRDGKFYVAHVIPGGPADVSGIRPFDRIDKVGGLSTEGMTVAQLINFVRGITGTPVTLTLHRPGSVDPIELTMARATIRTPSIIGPRVLKEGVGYVHLLGFGDGAASEFRTALSRLGGATLQALILDVRGGGPRGGFRELDRVLDALLPPGTKAYVLDTRRGDVPVVTKGLPTLPPQARLILLIDESDVLSGVLAVAVQNTRRGLLVDTRIFSQAGQTQRFELKDGSALEITISRVLRDPRLRLVSVDPDVFVPMGTEEFEAGRDRQLEEALQRLQ